MRPKFADKLICTGHSRCCASYPDSVRLKRFVCLPCNVSNKLTVGQAAKQVQIIYFACGILLAGQPVLYRYNQAGLAFLTDLCHR